MTVPGAAAQGPQRTVDVLRARQFVVTDEKGTDRIVIGPVPDPQILGKRVNRRSAGTGIQLNDANGNERGGLAIMDDGSVVVGIDDEAGRERAHLYFIPKKGSGLLLQGEGGKQSCGRRSNSEMNSPSHLKGIPVVCPCLAHPSEQPGEKLAAVRMRGIYHNRLRPRARDSITTSVNRCTISG
jgi:hypothetical protein